MLLVVFPTARQSIVEDSMILETRSSMEGLGKPHCGAVPGVKDGASTETQSRYRAGLVPRRVWGKLP
ncbi:hypothetical protein M404DRAFT_999810 [Pisolithus tinctorius Marx 270]|uniref:Uncharacterized protein n=1 Tax=Pisolithus tinctorius Marx 270 TaxID=870435 RepID=A0A0C3NWL2_PISTI|nr:hypothetical protein M404DRAFT_999810 [Pisolithus tinctorius Marx 270]